MDNNLGPVAVTILKYIQDALVHLKDEDTYLIIPEEEALLEDKDLRSETKGWLQAHHRVLPRMTKNYISSKLTAISIYPFGYFYLLYKLHNNSVTTKPVCSDCATIPHALEQWVVEMLQPIFKA